MAKYLIATHGKMCLGLKDTLEFIYPSAQGVYAVPFFVEETEASKEVDDFFNALAEDETAVIFTDIAWGSVNQKLMAYMERPNTYLISGVNLPILLEVIPPNDDIDRQSLYNMVHNCRDTLVFVNDLAIQEKQGDE